MKLETAEALALKLMKKHGLLSTGWTFAFDRAEKRLGCTKYAKKTITISRFMTEVATVALVEQVILHEIAHALLPAGIHHKHEWEILAAKIGYSGGRLMQNPYKPKPSPKASQSRAARPKVISQSYPDLPNGTVLTLPNGTDVTIVKPARSRYHAVDSMGNGWTIRFGYAKTLMKI
jgi:hypothetical protein